VAQCFAENTGDAGVLVNGGSGVRFSQTSITKATADGFAIQGASVSLSQSRVTGCGSTAVHAADDAHSNHSTVHVIGLESSGNAADFLAGTSSVIYTATESVVGGSPPAPTPTIIAGLGSTGTVTVEAGSNDLAGVILLNPGGSGIANYAIIHLAFSATLPGNTPVVTPSLEDGAANWGAGSSLGLSTVHVTGRANDGFEVTALNARWDNVSAVVGVTLAAGSNQYRIPYRVALK
jgi:hypothetical protein